jgi:outer membrane lipoprotein-sorting protein
MDGQEGTAKFKQADTLFKQGQFGAALALLDELDTAFPNTKNILYPKALCLEKLGRLDEAEAVCDVLARQFEDPRAQTLKARIQASRGAAGGVDMSGLDDLFGPAPKRTPVRVAAPSLDWQRYAVIGLIVVAVVGVVALGYVGYQKGWFPGRGESIEQVEGKIIDFLGKANTYTADLQVTGQTKQQGMNLGVNGGATLEYMKKDGKPLFRVEGAVSVSGAPMPMDVTLLGVSDGANLHMQTGVMGQQMVMKFPVPASADITPDAAKKAFEDLHKEFDVKLLPKETLDGVEAYTFELTPKPGSDIAASAQKAGQDFGKVKAQFTKDFTTQMRVALLDKSGAPQFTLSVKNMNLSPTLSPDRFAFKPPDGVTVMDMSDASMLMKMMGGPGGVKP